MKFFIPIIIGAIIGYFTNWLAIKMLFRPYNEIRIMNIKIPFTPGLIPKERERISKSIGNTVGVYLLSPETIIESLANEKIDKSIKEWLEKKINDIKKSQKRIKEYLINILGDNYSNFREMVEIWIKDMLLYKIREDEFIDLIDNIIRKKIDEMDTDKIYEAIDHNLSKFILELSRSGDSREKLASHMELSLKKYENDERKLWELLPKDTIEGINNLVDNNKDEIVGIIRDGIKDPEVEEKLKLSIEELANQNMSKIIMTFISSEAIADKAFNMIDKYLESPKAEEDINLFIKFSINRLLDKEVSNMIPKVTNSMKDDIFRSLVDIIMEYISEEDNYGVLLKSIDDKLKDNEGDIKENIVNYLNSNIKAILNSSEIEMIMGNFIKKTIDKLEDIPVSSILKRVDGSSITSIYGKFRVIFDKFAVEELPHIIKLFNIPRIVEEKINTFEMDFVESLILDIAEKELKAITWLGALLGGIIGILTPLLQLLY